MRKKAGPGATEHSPVEENLPVEIEGNDDGVDDPGEVRGKDGLTDAEGARKRYERRQAERARSRAKQQQRQKKAQQNKKDRNCSTVPALPHMILQTFGRNARDTDSPRGLGRAGVWRWAS